MISDEISNEIQNAKFFSILADEASDVSNVEQMALVLRYVDSVSKIREDFLRFVVCDEGLCGRAITTMILLQIIIG